MDHLLVVNGQPLVYLGDNKVVVTTILQNIMLRVACKPDTDSTRFVEEAVMIVRKDKTRSIFSIAKTI